MQDSYAVMIKNELAAIKGAQQRQAAALESIAHYLKVIADKR